MESALVRLDCKSATAKKENRQPGKQEKYLQFQRKSAMICKCKQLTTVCQHDCEYHIAKNKQAAEPCKHAKNNQQRRNNFSEIDTVCQFLGQIDANKLFADKIERTGVE